MKKIILLALASVMFLLPQCKKNTVTPVEDNGFYMTLTAGCGDRTAFTPSTGAFVWSDGATEYIYVGGSNHDNCLGKLSGTGTGTSSMTFSGTLTYTPTEGETLYFFYLGKGAEKTGTALTTLDFSTQDGTLANVTDYHIAIGTGSYSSGTVNYATTLDMKMAIAYFNVNGFKNSDNHTETVYIHGNDVYSTATVDYRNGRIVGDAKGFINVGKANTGKYVALIPSVATETAVKFDSNSKTGSLTFNRGIQAGKFYADNNNALSVTAHSLPEGATPGLFSMSATEMVRFSKGNLQYKADGTPNGGTWRFALNQYDFVGDATNGTVKIGDVKCNNESISVDYIDGWIDLFGWGTSGYHNPDDELNVKYYPYSYGYDYSNWQWENRYGYGPSINMPDPNLTGTSAKYDWGIYNPISNGGNEAGLWHVLGGRSEDYDCDGWDYITRRRSIASELRYVKGRITGVDAGATQYVNGLILLPDDWDADYYTLSHEYVTFLGDNGYDFANNEISLAEWTSILEPHGAVFLPACGYRQYNYLNDVGYYANYWANNYVYNNGYYKGKLAYTMYFYYTTSYYSLDPIMDRHCGNAVRLVMDVN